MHNMEYIKWFVKYIDDETPVLFIYEIDKDEERYATRLIEIFQDKHIERLEDKTFVFVTEAPIPEIEEINVEDEYWAVMITEEEFENLWNSKTKIYTSSIEFPRSKV